MGGLFLKLKLRTIEINLPNDYDSEQREELVKGIMDKYPDDFKYTYFSKMDRLIEKRLEILATYLLNGMSDIRNNVMSKYKENNRVVQEKSTDKLSV